MSEISTPAEPHPPRRCLRLTEAQALVASWQASGLSVADFVRRHGVSRSTLTSCRKRVAEAKQPAGFVEVRPVPAPPRGGTIEVALGAFRVHLDALAAETLLPVVLRALREAAA
jgi:hypothetical protein